MKDDQSKDVNKVDAVPTLCHFAKNDHNFNRSSLFIIIIQNRSTPFSKETRNCCWNKENFSRKYFFLFIILWFFYNTEDIEYGRRTVWPFGRCWRLFLCVNFWKTLLWWLTCKGFQLCWKMAAIVCYGSWYWFDNFLITFDRNSAGEVTKFIR